MKKINLFSVIAFTALLLTSCGSVTTLQKDIKRMDIRFAPLTRADVTLVGNLEADFTISGQAVQGQKVLDKNFSANLKTGKINSSEATEILYFAPKAGEAITGSLYENEMFSSVFASRSLGFAVAGGSAAAQSGLALLFAQLAGKKAYAGDPGMDFAYYALIEKYPDVDYFINVRFDRQTIVTGKTYTEKVTVKADGVQLKAN